MKVAITIKGFIDIPDIWADPKESEFFPLEVADYHYNEKLDEEDAIDSLATQLKAYKDDFVADFAWPETNRDGQLPTNLNLDAPERPVAEP